MCVAPAGADVVVVKSGRRVCGSGACLANAPLHQNKSYFEFKIQSTGEQAGTGSCRFSFLFFFFVVGGVKERSVEHTRFHFLIVFNRIGMKKMND